MRAGADWKDLSDLSGENWLDMRYQLDIIVHALLNYGNALSVVLVVS